MIRYFLALAFFVACSTVAQAKNWDEGGNLHGGSISGWSICTEENALASAADYIKGSTDAAQLSKVKNTELKEAAAAVAACVQKLAEPMRFPASSEDATPLILRCMEQVKANHPWMLTKPLALAEKAVAASEPEPVWDVAKAKPLPYAVYDAQRDHRATTGRTKLNLRMILASKNAKGQIIPLEDTSTVTKEQLAATVIAAAKHYAKAAGVQFVGVALDSQFGAGVATTQLAVADYAPDGKGVSGKDNWTWQQVKAAENGLTKQELAMQELWGQWRDQFQTAQGITDEAALSAAIGKKLGIAPSDVSTAYKPLFDVPENIMKAVAPAAGLQPKKQ
ncbi:DUF4875 domain-containing protein [Desulfovibrio falkowii]|uniref:DUF4875 domain-containing protein n=1 Tax=Desulfovibrio sp. WGS1351 TaxID=3366814 RepID=UPI00372CFCCD